MKQLRLNYVHKIYNNTGRLSYLSKLGQWSGSYNEAITFEEGGVFKAINIIERRICYIKLWPFWSLSTILQLLEDTSDSHERPVLQMWAAWKLNDFINCTLENPKLSLDFRKILKAAEPVLNLEGLPCELVTLLSNIKTLSLEQTVQDAS